MRTGALILIGVIALIAIILLLVSLCYQSAESDEEQERWIEEYLNGKKK